MDFTLWRRWWYLPMLFSAGGMLISFGIYVAQRDTYYEATAQVWAGPKADMFGSLVSLSTTMEVAQLSPSTDEVRVRSRSGLIAITVRGPDAELVVSTADRLADTLVEGAYILQMDTIEERIGILRGYGIEPSADMADMFDFTPVRVAHRPTSAVPANRPLVPLLFLGGLVGLMIGMVSMMGGFGPVDKKTSV